MIDTHALSTRKKLNQFAAGEKPNRHSVGDIVRDALRHSLFTKGDLARAFQCPEAHVLKFLHSANAKCIQDGFQALGFGTN